MGLEPTTSCVTGRRSNQLSYSATSACRRVFSWTSQRFAPSAGLSQSRIQDVIMDATTLRNIQAPIKDKYRKQPDAALIQLRAEGRLDDLEGVSCSVDT